MLERTKVLQRPGIAMSIESRNAAVLKSI